MDWNHCTAMEWNHCTGIHRNQCTGLGGIRSEMIVHENGKDVTEYLLGG